MQAIALQRETFQDEDHVRIHPIITRGGAAVSSVPANVTMEMFIRAASIDAIKDAGMKVDQALRAGAMAIGAAVEISTSPGYIPSQFNPALNDIYDENVLALPGDLEVGRMPHRTSSTDMGDVSVLMPTMQSYAGGASGRSHSDEYEITDWELDVVEAGKALASTTISLLSDDATPARKLIDDFDAPLTIPEYLATLREFRNVEMYEPDSVEVSTNSSSNI
jgi:metal-dependent amidase/aminoacylase/carboxypeptidase family protein